MSQNVVVFFNKDVIIIKLLMIAVLLMKIAFLGAVMPLENGRICTSKTSFGGGGSSLTACDFPGYLQQIPGNLKS